jgi:hypothetical protein
MNRKLYLELCQKCAVIPNKQNIPLDCLVMHNGIKYYPIGYELYFTDEGQPKHKAVLHDLHANSICYAMLEGVSELNKEEVIKLIKRNKNPRNEAITLIADFLVLDKEEAEQIYIKEFER